MQIATKAQWDGFISLCRTKGKHAYADMLSTGAMRFTDADGETWNAPDAAAKQAGVIMAKTSGQPTRVLRSMDYTEEDSIALELDRSKVAVGVVPPVGSSVIREFRNGEDLADSIFGDDEDAPPPIAAKSAPHTVKSVFGEVIER